MSGTSVLLVSKLLVCIILDSLGFFLYGSTVKPEGSNFRLRLTPSAFLNFCKVVVDDNMDAPTDTTPVFIGISYEMLSLLFVTLRLVSKVNI